MREQIVMNFHRNLIKDGKFLDDKKLNEPLFPLTS